MLSVIIPTHNSDAALAALLEALVPAAVDGLVREVICADAGSTDATLAICEDAGARMVAGGLVAAAGAAKGAWLLVLPVEIALTPDWSDRMKAHLARGQRPAVVRGVRMQGLAAYFKSTPSGLLIEAAKLKGRAETREAAALVRALGGGATKL